MPFNWANDHFFMHLGKLPSDRNLPIGSQVGAEICQCASNPMWSFEEHRQVELRAQAIQPQLTVF